MSEPLPIDPLLPELLKHLRESRCLVLQAPPGAGKTTRVPRALLEAGIGERKEIIVLEPRRLAARLAARRVAEELGERVGETVGYQVRFDEVAGPYTCLRFITEGILTRRLLSDPFLESVSAVVLDEFHERHLQADVAIALLRRLQLTTRPDLRLLVMSATVATAPVAHFLGDCATFQTEGKRYPVNIEYLSKPDDRALEIQIAAAVRRLLMEGWSGDILVFLPGAAEIRRAHTACANISSDLLVLPLHGDLPPAQQDRAIRPTTQRKIILSTNVAESSVTIEGVTVVIDSGLARTASYSPWSGLPMLRVERISQASAIQRAGRAGRLGPGRCLRLYTKADYEARPQHEIAEIHRADLAETMLELSAAGINDCASLQWLETPPAATIDAAKALLNRLGAINNQGTITTLGRKMLAFPVHPRQARLICEAQARGVASDGCLLAALIGERDIRITARAVGLSPRHFAEAMPAQASSDLLVLLDSFKDAEQAHFSPERLRTLGLEAGATLTVERVRRHLVKLCRSTEPTHQQTTHSDTALLIALLAGYPDRVARCRPNAGDKRVELLLANGGSAQLAESSVVQTAQFLLAIDAEQRQGQTLVTIGGGRSATTLVRLASAIEPDWLIELFFDAIQETDELIWDEQTERVEAVRRLYYDQLIIEESRSFTPDPDKVASLLTQAALTAGPRSFVSDEQLDHFLARINLLANTIPEAGFVNLNEEHVQIALAHICVGYNSFAQLRKAIQAGRLILALEQLLTPEQRRQLQTMAPERIPLPNGRLVRIHYELDKPPWIASRLQDFFGMAKAPTIAGGRVKLVLHLLAPNQRPVQVTTDLASFWTQVYPQLRKELSRRYPRHAWPENPLASSPPTASKIKK
ncbi:MAG: ATP-dependent helicase HrpB [Acidobacteriota bacterium]